MNIEERRIDELLNARWPLDTALENFEFRYDAIEALLAALSAMRTERDEAREKLGECHAGYETLRKELAAAQAERDEAMASRTRWQIALAESNQSVASLQNRLRDKHKELAAEKAMHNETRGELAYMTKLCQSEQEQLAKTTLNLSDSERDLAAAREALEHAEIFFRRILVAYDNPIPVDAKSSLWSDRADYMAKCARAGEERTRAALGKRGEE